MAFARARAREEIADSLEAGDHYTTYGNNPVMCAAACATIDYIIENRLWEKAKKLGEFLMKRLKEMERKYDVVGEARGKGLMTGLEIVKDKKTKEPGAEETDKIRKFCADHGLIVGKGGWWNNVIRIQPPMTLKEEHVEEALETLEKAVKEVKSK